MLTFYKVWKLREDQMSGQENPGPTPALDQADAPAEMPQEEPNEKQPVKGSGTEDAATALVKRGLDIRKDFWEDFINLSGDADAMAQLLDVPKEKVSSWASKINSIIDNTGEADSEQDDNKEPSAQGNNKVMPTGNSVAKPAAGNAVAQPTNPTT